LLVESTNTLNRAQLERGVSARTTTSLPSSSKVTDTGPAERPTTLEEGASSSPQQPEDTLTLSSEAGQSLSVSDATPVQQEESAQPVSLLSHGESAPKAEVASPTGDLIETSLESARSREAERLEELQEELSETLNSSLSLRFKEDTETGIDFFQLVESESGDVVRQIPSEDVIEFIKKFQNSVSGLFLSEQA
jgi:flagellar protein FlaG